MMKLTPKTFAGILVILLIPLMLPGQVQAYSTQTYDDPIVVSITRAEYIDLDLDELMDDVLTNFDVETPIGDWDIYFTIVFCELILPSGHTFYYILDFHGDYSKAEISIGWYNCAIESGWYLLRVHAFPLGYNAPGYGNGETLFDPPEDGGTPGDPLIDVLNITKT